MIKRIFTLLTLLICLYTTASANREISIELDGKHRNHSERLGFAIVSFDYLYNVGNEAIVKISIENITQDPPLAVLMFRRDMDEKSLKKGKPKIEFEKKYPGEKGRRRVVGCGYDRYQSLDIITAAEKDTLFTVNVPFSDTRVITLPIYVAKYNPKDLHNKGEFSTKYKIFEEYLYDIHIKVEDWNEEDATYVSTKHGVEQYIASLKSVTFCPNKKHKPSLEDQQRSYKEKKDSLIHVINAVLESHYDWMSNDEPHKAYTKLLTELNEVNLDAHNVDCGGHRIIDHNRGGVVPSPKCGYCSLSSQEIYYRLDKLFQQLYVGRISKEQALKTAQDLYNCYRHKRRTDSNSYGSKITTFYNKIAGF